MSIDDTDTGQPISLRSSASKSQSFVLTMPSRLVHHSRISRVIGVHDQPYAKVVHRLGTNARIAAEREDEKHSIKP
jgi:hypothetical protein